MFDLKYFNIGKYLRLNEWIDTKVPMLMSVVIYFYWSKAWSFGSMEFFGLMIVFFLFNSFFLAFGYVINDYADWEFDIKAGKSKIMHSMKKEYVILSLIFLVFLSIIPIWIFSGLKLTTCICIIITFFCGATYSIKPFRFKERGIWGLLVASVAQRCIPLIVLRSMYDIPFLEFTIWIILSFLVGLRYILVHQIIDMENDRISGTKTFMLSYQNMGRYGIYISFVIESMLLVYLFWKNKGIMSLIWVLFYLIYLTIQIIAVKKMLKQNIFETFSCVPHEDLYNGFIPLILLLDLAIKRECSWLYVFIAIVILHNLFWRKFKIVLKYLRYIIKGGKPNDKSKS